MKIRKFEGRDEWLEARRGKITGTRLKDVVVRRGTGRKIGFYELIAERLGIPADGENPMDRGRRLEEEAIAKFEAVTKRTVDQDLVIWTRDEEEGIAVSPDGTIGDAEAVEVKCLSSARHIEAYLTKKVPDEYEFQALQYFIVNDRLETLHFLFYDPRMPVRDFFQIEIRRADIGEKIGEYLEYQRSILREVEQIVNELTF